MSDDERGVIHNRERGKQIIDFSSIRFGNMTPTDVDMGLDMSNQAWILAEYKVKGIEMPYGQQLFYERICDDLSSKKPSIVLVANHEEPPQNDIHGGTCLVSRYYYMGKWRVPKEEITVVDAINKFLKLIDGI